MAVAAAFVHFARQKIKFFRRLRRISRLGQASEVCDVCARGPARVPAAIDQRVVKMSRCLPGWMACLSVLAGLACPSTCQAASPERPDVLFIAIDDLRDWIGYLGVNDQVKTPHLDRLAARGVSFTRSYCAAPVCNPSRAALLSGLRPSTTGVYGNSIDWREVIPNSITTLPAFFKANGYHVAGAGKIFHGAYERPSDWSEYLERPGGDPKLPAGRNDGVGGIKFAPLDCEDADLVDYRTVTYSIEQLNKPLDKPLFIACGLHKPHMPWNVPRKYFDLYPLEQVKTPKVLDTDLDDVPPSGVKMANPGGDHAKMLESGRWKEAVQAYLATITFADAMIGRLIDGLDKSPRAKDTIIVLWCDHGWHLGEKLHWRKFALWEEATRSPLIYVVPGMTKPGSTCQRTVDFMSIYPTLADLCGLKAPAHVEGESIRPLLEDPARAWSKPAVTTHGYQNHAVRSEGWRYIRYADGGEELYDETKDRLEWVNLAAKPELASIKSELAAWLPAKNVPTPKEKGENPKRAKKQAKRAKKDAS